MRTGRSWQRNWTSVTTFHVGSFFKLIRTILRHTLRLLAVCTVKKGLAPCQYFFCFRFVDACLGQTAKIYSTSERYKSIWKKWQFCKLELQTLSSPITTMTPFNTFFSILVLAIPLAIAMPRYPETNPFRVTSLEGRWGFLLHYC